MSKQSGLTMLNLIIYVFAMVIVVSIIATITSFFYTNINNLEDGSANISEITQFNMYFLEDIQKENNQISKINAEKNSITFLSGNTYTFQDEAIYLNSIKICEDVKNMQIEVEENSGKTIIKVLITLGNTIEFTKTMTYVM